MALLHRTVSYLSKATSRIPALSAELALLRYLWNKSKNIFLMVLYFLFRNREERSRANSLIPDLPFVWVTVLKPFRQDLPITHLRSMKAWQDYTFPFQSSKSSSKELYAGKVVRIPHTVGESIHSPSVVDEHGNFAKRLINSGSDIPPQWDPVFQEWLMVCPGICTIHAKTRQEVFLSYGSDLSTQLYEPSWNGRELWFLVRRSWGQAK